MNSRVLGFDILANPRMTRRTVWDSVEREAFLIRPEIEHPFSVDRGICPSIFQPLSSRSRDVNLPPWPELEMNMLGLWSELDKMLEYGEQREVKKLSRASIAIRVTVEGSISADPYWSTFPADPANIPSAWQSLGFDVADQDQTSALSNCSYKPGELEEARIRWSTHINNWGLLENSDVALTFAEFSDIRVPDHRPFYIYELFDVGRTDGNAGGNAGGGNAGTGR